jgi:hypothetical protein
VVAVAALPVMPIGQVPDAPVPVALGTPSAAWAAACVAPPVPPFATPRMLPAARSVAAAASVAVAAVPVTEMPQVPLVPPPVSGA